MSLEWTWVGIIGAVLLPALGHLYHFVLAVNISSGLGLRESRADRIRAGLFAGLFASAALLLWCHWQSPWWTWAWPARAYALLCLVSGSLTWPLLSLRIGMRRRPAGVAGQSELLDLRDDSGASALIGRGRHRWQLRLPGNEAFLLRKREWELSFPELPEALDGLSIVHLTDLHLAPCYDRAYFDRVVAACQSWPADLVVITGDLIDDDSVLPWVSRVLDPLEARLGKYAILGNHDVEHQPQRIIDELAAAGFESLEARWITIDEQGTRLAIGGSSEPWGNALDPGTIPPGEFRLLLSHSPDLFYRAQCWGVDLMLCGHNHGGQVRLPAVGPVFMPSLYSRRFDRGFFRGGSTLMYVSEGIGGKQPYRYGCTPEVCRFVLRRSPHPSRIRRET
jgi:predicted MPP superfamily phosphohydrolase